MKWKNELSLEQLNILMYVWSLFQNVEVRCSFINSWHTSEQIWSPIGTEFMSRMPMDLGLTGTTSQIRRAGADAECRVREQHSLCFISCLWCWSTWLLWRSSCFPGVSS